MDIRSDFNLPEHSSMRPNLAERNHRPGNSPLTYRIVITRTVPVRKSNQNDFVKLADLLEISSEDLEVRLSQGSGAISGHLHRTKAVEIFKLMKQRQLPVILLSSDQYDRLMPLIHKRFKEQLLQHSSSQEYPASIARASAPGFWTMLLIFVAFVGTLLILLLLIFA